ncbi:MAG: hypothetical protein IH623_24360 [Verrucomicrobia bacterium]|nr:hypothetical protein [Verrucomicrobiota bacterium]
MKKLKPFACLTTALLLTVAVGCRDSSDSHGHSHDDGHGHSHGEHHAPPHGGTPVVIADDKFHLELLLDATAGKMQAYVLDGHLEGYIQVPETSFVLVAKVGEQTEQLNFQRAPAPGSTTVPEKSSLFEAQADWLKTAKEFAGGIPSVTLNGATFTNISFSFPKGSKHVH